MPSAEYFCKARSVVEFDCGVYGRGCCGGLICSVLRFVGIGD